MKPQSRPGCNPGGGSFAPGWSLYSLPGLFSVHPHRAAHSSTPGRWTAQPPRVQSRRHTEGKPPGTLHHSPGATPAHSRHRGRTEPRNRARVQEYRQAPKQPHRAANRLKTGNRRKWHSQPHRATKRRPGYSYTTPPGKMPQSRPQPCTGASNPQPRKRTPPETPVKAPQSHAGPGCCPYTTRRQNAAQERTEPPTEGKPPGV